MQIIIIIIIKIIIIIIIIMILGFSETIMQLELCVYETPYP